MALHRIDQIVEKVSVMHSKAQQLYFEKYLRNSRGYDRIWVDNLLADIQSLARDIAEDTEKHPKLVEKDDT